MPVLGRSAADPWGTLALMTDPAANAARGAPGTLTARTLGAAELLSIGTELTVGETRDTNAGEIARDLTQLGVVTVERSRDRRISACRRENRDDHEHRR